MIREKKRKKAIFSGATLIIALLLLMSTIHLRNPTSVSAQPGYCANQRLINQWSCKKETIDLCDTRWWFECPSWAGVCYARYVGECKVETSYRCEINKGPVDCQSSPCQTVNPENDCAEGAGWKSSCKKFNSQYKGCWVYTCGNGVCESQYGENSSNCSQDCGAACSWGPWENQNCGGGSCSSDERLQTRWTNPAGCTSSSQCVADAACAPTCTVDLNPISGSISVGTSQDFTASVVPTNGTVDQVNFSSSDTGVATVNPASDASSPYQTSASGVGVGNTTITSDVVMAGAVRCTDTSSLDVTPPGPWWQVGDADVITNGNLISSIPPSCTLPSCDPAFGLEGPGGYPGVPSYGGSYDFEAGSGTGSVSSTGWLANTTTTFSRVYDYSYFQALVRPDVIINEIIEPEIQGGYLINQGTSSRGYVWFRRQGDLTITGTANLQDRKVVLLVDGDLYLGRPPGQSGSSIRVRDGVGFFMAIVSGDIIISSKATIDPLNPQPVLEGIFLAEGQVKTGTDGAGLDEQLWIRGSVAAYGGVVLERDLTDNSLTPAEFIEYGPDFLFTFPRDLTSRRYKWKEVAP